MSPQSATLAETGPSILAPDKSCVNTPGLIQYKCPSGFTCDISTSTCQAINDPGQTCTHDSDCYDNWNGNVCQQRMCTTSAGKDIDKICHNTCSGSDTQNDWPDCSCTSASGNPDPGGSTAIKIDGKCSFVTDQSKNGAKCLMPDNTYGICDGTPLSYSTTTSSYGTFTSYTNNTPYGGTGKCVNTPTWCRRSDPVASSGCIGGIACPSSEICVAADNKCETHHQDANQIQIAQNFGNPCASPTHCDTTPGTCTPCNASHINPITGDACAIPNTCNLLLILVHVVQLLILLPAMR